MKSIYCTLLTILFAFPLLAQTSTLSTGGANSWTGGTWSAGVPSGAIDAIVATGVQAESGSAATPTYTGSLTIQSDAKLTIKNVAGAENAIGGGTVSLETAHLRSERNPGTTFTITNNIQVTGSNIISYATDNKVKTLSGAISGTGSLTLQGNNNIYLDLTQSNTFSGGLVLDASLSRWALWLKASGAAGQGDVTCIRRTSDGQYPWIVMQANDVFADTATLTLDGEYNKNGGMVALTDPQLLLTRGYDDTISRVVVNGYSYPSGTYGAIGTIGVTYNVWWMDDGGILTVTDSPVDATPPTAIFAGSGAAGQTNAVMVSEPTTYTVTFSEPHTPLLTTANFENALGAGIEIISVTPLIAGADDNLSYQVAIKATSAGSLKLKIKDSTGVTDWFGNPLATPSQDDDTIIVNPLPQIGGELGIWKPWVNGGINPATSNAWQKGDQYRLVFVSSTGTNAVNPDLTAYDSFLQVIAANSTNYPLLGNTIWKVIGSSGTIDARDHTQTNPTEDGDGVAIILMDGQTMIAKGNATLWDNGIDYFLNLDENGNIYSGNVYTGSNGTGTKSYDSGSASYRVFGGSPESTPKTTNGQSSQKDTKWMQQYSQTYTTVLPIYAISEPLTVVSTAPKGTVLVVH